MRIGIPKALIFYKYFPFAKAFLEELGQEVITSSDTDREIMEKSVEIAEGDFCLPLKIFYGHLVNLKKKKVDSILVPRIISIEKNSYTCPKLLGLPDLVRSADIEDLPEILELIIDQYEGKRKYLGSIFDFGKNFTKSNLKIAKAYFEGVMALRKYQKDLRQGKIGNLNLMPSSNPKLIIGLVAHSYNILDRYPNMDIIRELRKQNIGVKIPEMVSHKDIKKQTKSLGKKLFWSLEKEILGAGLYWARNRLVDGLIYVIAFPCGPDSFIKAIIEYEIGQLENPSIPIMTIVIDEHSSPVGQNTRIEAFTDMLMLKKRKQVMNQ